MHSFTHSSPLLTDLSSHAFCYKLSPTLKTQKSQKRLDKDQSRGHVKNTKNKFNQIFGVFKNKKINQFKKNKNIKQIKTKRKNTKQN